MNNEDNENNENSSRVFIMNNSSLNSSTPGSNEKNYTFIGSIKKNQQNLKTVNIIKKDNNQDIDYFNEQVLDFISKNDSINCEPQHFIFSNSLIGLIFKVLKWRRCTGYLVIQKSDYGTRFLCYLHDEIKHNAQCFGTSYYNVMGSEIKKYFDESYPLLLNNLKKAHNILKIEDSIQSFSNFDNLFGL